MNNQECQIRDEEEEDNNRFNFRRFTQEEIIQRNNPFERVKKKEPTFPFLFQKKKPFVKHEKVSLDEIISKVKDLSFNSPTLYSPHTPQYPPWDLSGNIIMPSLDLNDISGNLNMSQPMELDG